MVGGGLERFHRALHQLEGLAVKRQVASADGPWRLNAAEEAARLGNTVNAAAYTTGRRRRAR